MLPGQRPRQASFGVNIVRANGEGAVKFQRSYIKFSLLKSNQSHTLMRACAARVELHSFTELASRSVEVPDSQQHFAECKMSCGMVGRVGQRTTKQV